METLVKTKYFSLMKDSEYNTEHIQISDEAKELNFEKSILIQNKEYTYSIYQVKSSIVNQIDSTHIDKTIEVLQDLKEFYRLMEEHGWKQGE